MKPFETVELTYKVYLAIPAGADLKKIEDELFGKIHIKVEDYCTELTIGMTCGSSTMEAVNE
jgi:hypothetical protein